MLRKTVIILWTLSVSARLLGAPASPLPTLTLPPSNCPFSGGAKTVSELIGEINEAVKKIEDKCPDAAKFQDPFQEVISRYETAINQRFEDQLTEAQQGRTIVNLNCSNLNQASQELTWFNALIDQNLPLPSGAGYSSLVQNPGDPAARRSQLATEFGAKIRAMRINCEGSGPLRSATQKEQVAQAILEAMRPTVKGLGGFVNDCSKKLGAQAKSDLLHLAVQVGMIVTAFQPFSAIAVPGIVLGSDFLSGLTEAMLKNDDLWSTATAEKRAKFESSVCVLKKAEEERCAHLPKTEVPVSSPVKSADFKQYLEAKPPQPSISQFLALTDEFKSHGAPGAEHLLNALQNQLLENRKIPGLEKPEALLTHLERIRNQLQQELQTSLRQRVNPGTLKPLNLFYKQIDSFVTTARAWLSETNDVDKKLELQDKLTTLLEGKPAGKDEKGKDVAAVAPINFREIFSGYWKLMLKANPASKPRANEVEAFLSWEATQTLANPNWQAKRLHEYGPTQEGNAAVANNQPEVIPEDRSRGDLSDGFTLLITKMKGPIEEYLPYYEMKARVNSGDPKAPIPTLPGQRPLSHAMQSQWEKISRARDRNPPAIPTTQAQKAKYWDEHLGDLATACAYLAGGIVWEKGGKHTETADTAVASHGNALKPSLRDYYQSVCKRFECNGKGLSIFKEEGPNAVETFNNLRCRELASMGRKLNFLRNDFLTKNECRIDSI